MDDDRLQGDAGNDVLNGGAGIDTAVFTGVVATTVNLAIAGVQNTGHGNDTYISIENVISGAGSDRLIGNGVANVLIAWSGNDTLSGGGGNDALYGGAAADTLYGGFGNDMLQGDAGNDLLNGGAGIDTAVFRGTAATTVDLALAAGTAQNTGHGIDRLAYIENVVSGARADVLRGNGSANLLSSFSGNDWLYGAGGDDRLNGGNGSDRHYGDAGNDRHYGDAGNDRLYGDAGDDLLNGGAGNDLLGGGSGNDQLIGGLGSDRLYGGGGWDTSVFFSAAEIGSGAARDTVADFISGLERIDLRALELSFIGSAGFSNTAGELRFVSNATGGFLIGDTDGNGAADFVLFLQGVAAIAVGDMIL